MELNWAENTLKLSVHGDEYDDDDDDDVDEYDLTAIENNDDDGNAGNDGGCGDGGNGGGGAVVVVVVVVSVAMRIKGLRMNWWHCQSGIDTLIEWAVTWAVKFRISSSIDFNFKFGCGLLLFLYLRFQFYLHLYCCRVDGGSMCWAPALITTRSNSNTRGANLFSYPSGTKEADYTLFVLLNI